MSSNAALAERLELFSRLLEVTGADSFRASAHARAARAVADWPADLCALALSPDGGKAALQSIAGIGPKLADKIVEFAKTGAIKELDELKAQVPPGLIALFEISGLGPKTIRALWQDAGVTDLDSLKKSIADGSIMKVPRMGEKAVQKISAAIAIAAQSAGRVRLGPAAALADAIIAHIKSVKGVREAIAAGSLRRGKETVGDLDILICIENAKAQAAAAEAFVTMPGVRAVLARGENRCSAQVNIDLSSRWEDSSESPNTSAQSGTTIQVDIRLMEESVFGAALAYFTGSKEHNVRMRQRALDRGLTLNEYGLFPNTPDDPTPPQQKGVKPVAGKSEQEIYEALDMSFVPPELREDRGEMESFELKPAKGTQHRPKHLIEISDIKAELHAHTTASDGVLSIVELAKEAKRRGFHTIAVTDHSRSSVIANGLSPDRLEKHIKAIHAARKEVEGITILAGSEVDILSEGALDYDDELLSKLDIVVASPHAALTQDPATATKRLLKAIQHPLVHILGHPTGRLVMRRPGLDPAMDELYAAAKEHNVALEINAHWMRLDLRDVHVRGAVNAGCLIAIDCDVHHSSDFDTLRFGVQTARRGWLDRDSCVNAMSHKDLHAWLKSKR